MINMAGLIDHSLLRPNAREQEILTLCDEAEKYGFHAVCIHPFFVRTARSRLLNTSVKVAAVIGFPLGMTLPEVKVYEALTAVHHGADELDVVINLSLAVSDEWKGVTKEISNIVSSTPDTVHKIIVETCYLTDKGKKKACSAVMEAGAAYIKTSTGFGPAGASVNDVKLIKSVTKGKIGIKAAGGIKTMKQAKVFVKAGATRIGTSSAIKMMKETSE